MTMSQIKNEAHLAKVTARRLLVTYLMKKQSESNQVWTRGVCGLWDMWSGTEGCEMCVECGT